MELSLQKFISSFLHGLNITDQIRPQDPTIFLKFTDEAEKFQGNLFNLDVK